MKAVFVREDIHNIWKVFQNIFENFLGQIKCSGLSKIGMHVWKLVFMKDKIYIVWKFVHNFWKLYQIILDFFILSKILTCVWKQFLMKKKNLYCRIVFHLSKKSVICRLSKILKYILEDILHKYLRKKFWKIFQGFWKH